MGWNQLAAVGNILGGVASIFSTLRVSVPKIKIPESIYRNIETKIKDIAPLSEQARANIQQALEMYKRGELLPQYKSKLDEEYENKKKQAESLLAARGLLNSSIALDVAAELNRWYLRSYYDLLYGQLRDALSMSGLAEADINALLSEAQAYSQALQAQVQNMAIGELLKLGQAQSLTQGLSMLGSGIQSLSQSFGTGDNLSERLTVPGISSEYTLSQFFEKE